MDKFERKTVKSKSFEEYHLEQHFTFDEMARMAFHAILMIGDIQETFLKDPISFAAVKGDNDSDHSLAIRRCFVDACELLYRLIPLIKKTDIAEFIPLDNIEKFVTHLKKDNRLAIQCICHGQTENFNATEKEYKKYEEMKDVVNN